MVKTGFSEESGYGFITCDDGKDVYVHFSNIEGEGFRTLHKEQRVEFGVEQSPKGPRAVQVRALTSAAHWG